MIGLIKWLIPLLILSLIFIIVKWIYNKGKVIGTQEGINEAEKETEKIENSLQKVLNDSITNDNAGLDVRMPKPDITYKDNKT